MEAEKTRSSKRVLSIVVNVFIYLFLGICVIALLLSLFAKREITGGVDVFGHQLLLVRSESMARCEDTDVSAYDVKDIPLRSMVIVKSVPEDAKKAADWYAELKKGDVLTFRYVIAGRQETISHRIIAIDKNAEGGYDIKLQGDNHASKTHAGVQELNTADEQSPNYVIGKVTGQIYPLGLLVYALNEPIGIVCIIIIPAIIIAVFEILKIASVLGEKKKRLAREEQEKREMEFQMMKLQLEMLQRQAAQANEQAAPTTEAPAPEEPDSK